MAGTRISARTSHYWWDGTVHEREYWTVISVTTDDQLDTLYDVDDYTGDDLPGITYREFDADDDYLEWIDSQAK